MNDYGFIPDNDMIDTEYSPRHEWEAVCAELEVLRAFKDSVPWEELYYAHDALQNQRQRKHDMYPHGQLVIDYAPALNKFINDNDTLVRAAFDTNAPKEATE